MHFLVAAIPAILAFSADVFAAPPTNITSTVAHLDARTEAIEHKPQGNSAKEPIPVIITVAAQSQLTFDADCYAILCKGAPDVLQHVDDKLADETRNTNGYLLNPFRNAQKYDVRVPPKLPSWSDEEFVSPEEYPFASSRPEKDINTFFCPVNLGAQSSQGGRLKEYLDKARPPVDAVPSDNTAKTANTWFKIDFSQVHLAQYCKALNDGDKSVCDTNKDVRGPWGFDVGKYMYQYNGKDGFKYVGK